MKYLFNLFLAMCIAQLAIAQNNTSYGTGTSNGGSNNSSFGYNAGSVVTGNNNSFFGIHTGRHNTTGSFNTFMGRFAGGDNLTGSYNTFIGSNAGLRNTTGRSNTFVGMGTGQAHTTGSGNSFFGKDAGKGHSTGQKNTFIGEASGADNISGVNNTFLGHHAGQRNKGSYNVFLGTGAGYSEAGSNKLYIHNTSSTNPLIYGDFSTRALNINGSLRADYLRVDPQNSFGEGGEIFLSGSGSNQGWYIDNYNGNFRLFGNGQVPFVVTPQGKVGIGTYTPNSFKLAVEGKIGAREIQVTNVNPWPDYVFAQDYKLRSLEEVESFIQQNKHLPDVPSAKTVKKEGVALGKMNATLLRKIEELTLYMISVKKEVKTLRQKVQILEKENQQLKKQNKK